MLFDGNQVGKGLQGVSCGSLHGEDGFAAVLDKLIENLLVVVVFAVFKAGKAAYANQVAVAGHHGDGLQQVFALVAIHDDTTFRLQLPCPLVHVEHDDVHAQVAGSLLRAQSGAQAVVEEDEQTGLVVSQCLELVTRFFNLKSLGQGPVQVAQVEYMGKTLHLILYLIIIKWMHSSSLRKYSAFFLHFIF